jgi:NADH-quinone oxidoreductase subunit G
VGPLIGMEEMTRCIHCTRCVRFGQEVAGVMELGMIHRGEHSEITTVHGGTVDSEISGNMIDLCPVGALTSKPFRYQARSWELSRRKSVSPHDSTGANLIVQVKGQRVMRVLPLENEAVNECWLADRDRFSYEGLNVPSRLGQPMIKQGGQWQAVDWSTALAYVADGLKRVIAEFGPEGIGAVGAPHATVEELHLLAKLVRGLGSRNIDTRLRATDAANLPAPGKAHWLGTSIASLSKLDRVLVVGSFLRKDHPLFAARIRQAARHGAQVSSLHAVHDDWALPVAHTLTAAPSGWVDALAQVAAVVAAAKGLSAPAPADAGDAAKLLAQSLLTGERKALLLGNAAMTHPQASQLLALAQWIGAQVGATVGVLGESGNSVGAALVNAMPRDVGLSAAKMLAQPMRALLLLNVEPLADSADAAAAREALAGSGLVVSMTPYGDANAEIADVLLPIAPFTETGGAFVNAEGRLQSFHGVVKPLEQTRPAWKVLRVLGNLLGVAGFEQETVEQVRAEALGDAAQLAARLDNAAASPIGVPAPRSSGLERIADVPIYMSDPIVRRSPPLQATADAAPRAVGLPSALFAQVGPKVLVKQGAASAVLAAREDKTLAPNTVRIAAPLLGPMFGAVTVERAPS